MPTWKSLFVSLCVTTLLGTPAFAADDYRNRWQADGWSGYDLFSNNRLFACDAVHDFGPHVSLRIERIAGRPASELILWDANGDIDFTTIADVGTIVTVSLGGTQREYKVKDAYSMILMVVPQPEIIELLAAGGSFSVKLPNGKMYSTKLPSAATAMAHYRTCLERNGIAAN
jgi:hypothetical protein